MSGIIDRLFGGGVKPRGSEEEYVELDLSEYEKMLDVEVANLYVKVAEIANLNELQEVKKEIYNGNIVITDLSLLKRDKGMMERAIRELKQVAEDIHGDIAGISEELIITTPTGVKIDRRKIVGGRH
ncbi:MAG: cell division protein SepF [Archaeoglobi archaeon]|nr:cell division protein SepF [Candidatus Mnemosynella sp.]MBC7114846.1 cell division protein SepF [Candidatus Mnemosynella bozhongmuii]